MHKRKKNRILCLCLLLFLIASCLLVFFPGASAAERSDVVVHTIDIGIRPSAYKELLSKIATEPNYPVQVSVDSGALFGGKLRLRGSASKAIGLITPGKRVALELKPDQTDLFAGSLDNSCVKLINSWTPMRLFGEYLAMEMYGFLGIPTPAHTLAFLQFNGVDFGLYIASEEVNTEFLQKFDPDGGGTLFKANENDKNSAYNASSWFGYLRVVEDHGFERVNALIEALDRGAGYEAYLDVDEVLRYFACLAVWGADDTILTEKKPSNFFLYDTGERFILIPWDSSEAFSAYNAKNGIDHFQRDPDAKDDSPPLFMLLMQNKTYQETYHNYIRQITDSFLAPELLDARFNALAAAASPYLERDCTMLCYRPDEISATLRTLHEIQKNLSEQLNGESNGYGVDPDILPSSDEEGAVSADEGKKDPEEELNEDLSFLIRYYSPRLDPDITEKICAAYPAWCRAQGKIPIDADDPAEIAVAAAVFTSVFLLLLILTGKKYKKQN